MTVFILRAILQGGDECQGVTSGSQVEHRSIRPILTQAQRDAERNDNL